MTGVQTCALPISQVSHLVDRGVPGSLQRRLPSHANRLVPLVLSVQTPVVAKVKGWAAGIGLNLALAADFTVATHDAKFWAPFTQRGFTADPAILEARMGFCNLYGAGTAKLDDAMAALGRESGTATPAWSSTVGPGGQGAGWAGAARAPPAARARHRSGRRRWGMRSGAGQGRQRPMLAAKRAASPARNMGASLLR